MILDLPLLLVQLMLALGGALFAGNLAVVLRHRFSRREDLPPRPPTRRLMINMGIGLVVAVWALATLLVRF